MIMPAYATETVKKSPKKQHVLVDPQAKRKPVAEKTNKKQSVKEKKSSHQPEHTLPGAVIASAGASGGISGGLSGGMGAVMDDDASADDNAPATDDAAVPPADKAAPRKFVLVIDPGHGGQDPGAIGPSGVFEKDITLGVAKALKAELEKQGGYKVVLTRTRDVFVRLKDRRDVGRREKADLFLSLHADSINAENQSVKGASLYTLSDKASDAESEKLAARENRADSIAGINLSDQQDEVATILIDLAVRETMNQSRRVSSKLAAALYNKGVRLLDNPQRAAGFAVLKAPDVPSVLLEMGFISSSSEEKLLMSDAHRRKLASGIADGINRYVDYLDDKM